MQCWLLGRSPSTAWLTVLLMTMASRSASPWASRGALGRRQEQAVWARCPSRHHPHRRRCAATCARAARKSGRVRPAERQEGQRRDDASPALAAATSTRTADTVQPANVPVLRRRKNTPPQIEMRATSRHVELTHHCTPACSGFWLPSLTTLRSRSGCRRQVTAPPPAAASRVVTTHKGGRDGAGPCSTSLTHVTRCALCAQSGHSRGAVPSTTPDTVTTSPNGSTTAAGGVAVVARHARHATATAKRAHMAGCAGCRQWSREPWYDRRTLCVVVVRLGRLWPCVV